jgi:steroid delta-isomerase-like uncharacterized protein
MTTAAKSRTASELARESFRVLFEERDLSDPGRFWTESSVDHFLAAGKTVRGPEALAQWFRDLFAAVPDWHVEIENVIDDGDRQAVVQWRGTGTLTGTPFLGIEPNGRTVEIHGLDVMRFDENDKIATNTVYYDGAQFARDLGMLPKRDSKADKAMLAAFNATTKLKRKLGK